MKLFTRLMLLLVAMALVLSMVVPGPQGVPIMRPADWFNPDGWRLPDVRLPKIDWPWMDISGMDMPAAEAAATLLPSGQPLPARGDGQGSEYYRWRDEQGVWQFSDEPPAGDETMASQPLPGISNRMQHAENEGSGTQAPMNSNIAPLPNVAGALSREALEQQLDEAHRHRMGAEL